MVLNTHLNIDESLCGEVVVLKENYAKVVLETTQNMVADKQGLVHGGFLFGAADYAAMAAVNDPFVVLAKSEVKFTAPTKVGQSVVFEAKINETNGNKNSVEVVGVIDGSIVFKGMFYTAILDKHVLEL